MADAPSLERPRFPLWDVLAVLLAAVALVQPARIPLEAVGFLSDDYYAGEHIARHADEHPALPDRIATTFTRRWIHKLEWFRPLTILSCAADFGMFGANGRLHHIQNLVFWVAAAAAAAFLYPRFSGSRTGFSVPMALLLVYPGAAETFGWIVAREDLFFAIFGCLALRARLALPTRSSRRCLSWRSRSSARRPPSSSRRS